MKTLVTLLLACCFGSAMAQSNLPACGGDPSRWDQCYGTDRSYYREIRGFIGKYSGEWVRGMPSGQGVLILPNGQGYVEASEIPKNPGIARKFVSDGGRYIGYFKNGLYDGSGVQYSKSGAVEKSGIWKDGNLVQSKFVDVATFTRIPNLSNSASNLAQLRKTEEQAIGQSNLPACQGARFTWTNCVGAYTYSSGAKYVGEYKDGKYNGQGTYTFANVCVACGKYVGEFKDGKYNGQGIWFRANGNVWKSGIWNDGLLVQSKFIDVATFTRIPNLSNSASNLAQLRKTEEQPMAQSNLPACQGARFTWTNCVGAYTFGSGKKYVGEYKDGKYNGQGTYTWPNGNKYVGEFKDDNFNGQGTYTWPNGNKYVGEFKDDNPNMQLTISYADGDKYIGEFKDDNFNGQFIVTYADGDKYVGEFKDGKYNGQGIQFLANGKVDKSGIWKDDKLVQSKFIDVATFTRIPNLSNSASNAESSLPACTGDERLWTDCYVYSGGFEKREKFEGEGYLMHSPRSRISLFIPKSRYLEARTLIGNDVPNCDPKLQSYPCLGYREYRDGNYIGVIDSHGIPSGLGVKYAQSWWVDYTRPGFNGGVKIIGEYKYDRPYGSIVLYNRSNEVIDRLVAGQHFYKKTDVGYAKHFNDNFNPNLFANFKPAPPSPNRLVITAQSAAESSAPEQDPNEDERSRLALFEKWQSDEIKRIQALSQPYLQAQANAKTELSDLEKALAEAELAKRKQAELEAQLAVAQQQAQVKPAAQIAPQGKRVALVIGNAKYKFNPLNNPVNDATDIAASLRSVGFDVIEVKDANKRQMRAATRRFEDKLAASDVGLVYYSGHGVEVKGRNYLIPVDADIRREHEVEDQAFDAGNILRMMESLQGTEKKRVNIMIVDACRNNDLARSWRSTNRGLARMDAPTGSFISFATAPGQVASDGNGRNSPFTKHLLQALKQPNVPIELVFKEVRRKVMAETSGEQVPWENSSLVGDFYFTVAR